MDGESGELTLEDNRIRARRGESTVERDSWNEPSVHSRCNTEHSCRTDLLFVDKMTLTVEQDDKRWGRSAAEDWTEM